MTSLPQTEASNDDAAAVSFDIDLSFQGMLQRISVTTSVTGAELHRKTMETYFQHWSSHPSNHSNTMEVPAISLKLLYQGKQIPCQDDVMPWAGINHERIMMKTTKKPPKILVMATNHVSIEELSTKRSDPTIRGLDQEKQREEQRQQQKFKQQTKNLGNQFWGEENGMTQQDKDYKFCRFQACTWQSFGHRPTDKTPHAFEAMRLLEKLATDPGIVSIMKERKLVVGTLAEMDPIDDRLMQRTQQEQSGGVCLLGYNTNHGARIDIKLRTDDLSSFRPYPELVSTLIHELSHNWVGEHNILFWTNYAQMRAEYLYTHAQLRSIRIVRGKTTAEWAGLDTHRLENILEYILQELVVEMRQHGLHPQMIEAPIRQRIQELEANRQSYGQRLGGGGGGGGATTSVLDATGNSKNSARELALAAALRRARNQTKKEDSS